MIENDLAGLRATIAGGGTVEQIDTALAPVAAARNAETIKPLLLMLNDDADDEAMWSLVHAAEQFDDATYISQLLSVLPDLVIGSSRWASILMMRVLNSDAARAQFVRQIRAAPAETRRSATLLCEGINSRDVRFLAKTTAVLTAATLIG